MFGIRAIFGHLKSMTHYLIFSCVIFLAGLVVGATNPGFESFIVGQMSSLKQVADSIESSGNPTVWFMVFIFFNNAIKSVLVMYLGALFGFVPFIFLAINGMMIGYLAKTASGQGTEALFVLLKGLLPHGIIEIPAIIIACAYGFGFAKKTFQGFGALFLGRKGWGSGYEQFALRSLPAIVLIVVMLAAAAVIESTVTVWLLNR